MKNIDVTDSVMKNVARYERTGISRWLHYFFVSISVIGISGIVVIVLIVNDLLEKHTFDLLELFSQDPEIIKEFGREVLFTFRDELPGNLIGFGVAAIVMLVCIVIMTKRKRLQIKKKMQQLEKYS